MKRRVLKDPETGEVIGLTNAPFGKSKTKKIPSLEPTSQPTSTNWSFWILLNIAITASVCILFPNLVYLFLFLSLLLIFYLLRKRKNAKLEQELELELELELQKNEDIVTKKIPRIISKLSNGGGINSLDSEEREILFSTTERISSKSSSLHPFELKLMETACGDTAIFNVLQLRGTQLAQTRQEEALQQISDKLSKVKHSSFAGPIAAWHLDNFVD